ncbi:MAG: zinc ribbon domain-containing protein [Clostridiales bacterium]|nr:zinc ribbon domain-containing protein [Clostridiales bacterium]
MAYCVNCGAKIVEGAKFCANCGKQVGVNENYEQKRKESYDGEVHKCPHCGEVLKAFETVCPTCNFELREVKSSNAVKDLAEKLQNVISQEQRINIIKNFPIPNTKEDIFEFILLASSNFDADYYVSHLKENDESDAWLSKIEQAYKKGLLSLKNEQDIKKLKEIYFEIKSKIKKVKFNKKGITVLGVFLIFLGTILSVVFYWSYLFAIVGMWILIGKHIINKRSK